MDLPEPEDLETFRLGRRVIVGEWRHIHADIGEGIYVDALLRFADASAPLLCFLPAAQPRENRRNPVYHRWTWADEFADVNIAILSESTLYASETLLAGWMMHPTLDIPTEVASVLDAVRATWKLRNSATLFYGSSMGGFEALQMASVTPGSRAVAEVPQLDMVRYAFPQALEDMERDLLRGSFMRHRRVHPEQVSILERFRHSARVPSARLITNAADHTVEDILRLPLEAAQLEVSDRGLVSVDLWPDPIGHRPLSRESIVPVLQRELADLRPSASATASPPTQVSEKPKPPVLADFRPLLEQGLTLAASVELTRDAEDRQRYEAALAALFAAAEADPTQDLPLLRACSLMKVWDMNYSARYLETARRALARRESVAAASFVARGLLASEPAPDALRRIEELRGGIQDQDTASILGIFRAIALYNAGEIARYEDEVRTVRQSLRRDFESYILVPFSTVMLPSDMSDAVPDPELVGALEYGLEGVEFGGVQREYSVVISCDLTYLQAFGPMLVSSFEQACSPGARLVMVVLGSRESAEAEVERLQSLSDRCEFVFIDVEPGANLGPLASLVRFVVTPKILASTASPVILMDVDAVILKDLSSLIESLGDADLGVRLLGSSPAPWEMYAAGVVVFRPTPAGRCVADAAAAGALHKARRGAAQWWIDQNALEFGIRSAQAAAPSKLIVHDLMGASNAWLVLPTGPRDTKVKVLRAALDRVAPSSR